uniref:SECIS binding protein 2 n=1 Tax=Bos mutus grunniens TaxID=30521 RepID=A0A8C0AF79_BOSMU
MASEGRREPAAEGIKLSADVKPFVPKFAGLNVGWSESSEARVFPSCAATPYYPCVQELAVPDYHVNVFRATGEDAPHPRRKCTAQLNCVAHEKLKIQLSFFSSIFIWLFGAEKIWRLHCIY